MLISVVMPAHNAEKYIREAIRSVMAQTFDAWELIVIDDGSADETCAIVEALALEDPRIQLVRSEKNCGVAYARNTGLSLARGEYVALLDSDDLWHPEKLEKQRLLAQKTGADVVYCGYSMIDSHGEKRWHDFVVPERTDYEMCLTQSVISCSTAMLSRSIAEKYRFDGVYTHEDLAMWLRILRDGNRAVGIPESLACYRIAKGSRSYQKCKAALGRWKIYRQLCGFSCWKSGELLMHYAWAGLRKYRRRVGKADV